MRKKQKKCHKKRHLPKAGICFEALEPRLLLSGNWGAVVDGPDADTQADAHGSLIQGSMVLHNDTGFSDAGKAQVNLTPEIGRVDLLSKAPALNTLGNPVAVPDASLPSNPVVPASDDTSATPLTDHNDATSNPEPHADTLDAAIRRELVFVNDNVAAYEILINGIRESETNRIIEIVVLDADRDGIQQVSDILADRSDLSAVHVIAHGSDGQISLGGSWLNNTTLQQNSDAVAGWGQALTETGDILFYGCNIAAGSDGQGLLDNITELTGAEVAASGDLTGSATFGGNWELEFTVGDIETSVAVNAEMQDNWSGVLVTATNVGTVADKSAAHTQTQITVGASGVSAGNTVIIAIALNFSNGEDLDVPIATDSQGNIYNTDIDVFPDGTAARLAIISADITTPLTIGDTVTVTHAPSAASTMSVQEFSGLLSSGALDQTASSFGDSSTASSGSTATTSQANELVFGATLVKGPVTQTFTEGGTYTLIGRDGTTGAAALSNRTINPEYKIVSSTGTYAADGTLGTSATWISAVATYKLAPAVNNAPLITSNGGDATANINVEENTTAVTTVTATDADLDTVSFSISGGADAAKFTINEISGELAFTTAPDFETPSDADTDNVYEVTVQVSDGTDTDSQDISVMVTDVNDAPEDIQAISSADGGIDINTDGGNNLYLVADQSPFNADSAVTIEVEFSATTPASGITPLFSYADTNNSDELFFGVESNGELIFRTSENGGVGYGSITSAPQLFDGQQHTVAVTWENSGGILMFYVDGEQLGLGRNDYQKTTTIDAGGTVVIGQHQGEPEASFDVNDTFSGTIYNVRVFDNVRSAGEIAASHASELPHDEAGMLAQWTFDDLSTDGIVTESVSGNNLTVKHVAEAGFTNSNPELTFSVDENAVNGTVVGTVSGTDAEREAQIAALLADNSGLVYSAETGKFYQVDSGWYTPTEARTNAESTLLNGVNGQLVTIRSAAENEFVLNLANSLGNRIWIGATDATVEGEWRWIESGSEADQFWSGLEDGNAVNGAYQNWDPGVQPNQSGEEDWAEMDTSTGLWWDNKADAASHYVTEWKADDVLDATDPLIYSIQSQTVAGAFALDADSGQITVADGSLLDYETNAVHTVTVRTSDGSLTYEKAFAISLADVVEFVVTNTSDGGAGSLRQAIIDANAYGNSGGPDVITFNIGADGSQQTINLLSALDPIGEAVIIDGFSQYGALTGTTPLIELNGAGTSGADGLVFEAGSDGSTIRGLVINRFDGNGIRLVDSDNHTIVGNYIGTDLTGTSPQGNGVKGLEINNSSGNLIGGSTTADRNVISGNDDDGIILSGSGSTLNVIQGNYIGVDITGNTGLGNGADGICISSGANNNTIGGDRTAGEGNVISGQIGATSDGIEIDNVGADNNKIYGNYIGTNFDGTADIANERNGVVIYDGVQGTEVGGTGTGQGNIISGNGEGGVVIDGNGKVTTTNNIVACNYIGVDITGSGDLGNATNGVEIFGSASGNLIGGESVTAGNVIAFNSQNGIGVANGTNNSIVRNSIHSNTLLGINLGSGANNDQNFPVLTSAVTNGAQITITGALNSIALTNFRIEFYSNTTGDPTGYGEGQTLIGISDVTTDGFGDALFSPTFSETVSAGSAISAIVSRLDGGDAETDTSEFAQNIAATAAMNNAPSLSTSAPFPSIQEDAVNNTGMLVSTYADLSTDADPGALKGIAITSLDNTNGTWQYTLDGSSWSDIGSVSVNNALLLASDAVARFRFVPNPDYAGSSGILNYKAWDQTTGSTGTYADVSIAGGTTAFSLGTNGAAVTVTPVNDAPLLDNSGFLTLTTITEDATGNSGNLISEIIASDGGDRITDVDSGAVEGIAITGLTSGNGTWEYNIGSGWTAVGAVSDTSAFLLRATDSLRFVPDGLNSDLGIVLFSAWDQTSGTAGMLGDRSSTGGDTAFSSQVETAVINVTAVNDAPVVVNLIGDVLSYTEGDGAVVIEQGGDVLVSDVDSSNFSGGSLNVEVDSGLVDSEDVFSIRNQGTGLGQIGVSGSNVTYEGDVIGTYTGGTGLNPLTVTFNSNATAAAVTALVQNITYENTNNSTPTVGARSVTIDINDGDGGGSQTQNLTINVSAVNDAPTVDLNGTDGGGTNFATTFTEDGGAVNVTDADAIITDVDDTTYQSLSINLINFLDVADEKIVIAGDTFTYGTTKEVAHIVGTTDFYFDFDGSGFNIYRNGGGMMPSADLQTLMRGITYENILQNPTSGDRVINFIAQDALGLVGPVSTSTITVNPVNDAPQATNLSAAETYTEDTALNLTDIVVSDVDSANVTVSLTLSDIAAGSLNTGTSGSVTSTFAAGVWTASGAIADVNSLLAGLLFTPSSNYNSNFTIATSVDDGVTAAITGSKAMTSTAVNDAPTDLLITDSSAGGLSLNQDGGNDAYFIADDGEAILGGLTAMTTEVQFSMDSFSGTQYFTSYETTSQSDSIRIGIHGGGEIRLLINGTRVDSTAMDYRTLADGEQHTLSVTWDSNGGLWEIFVDGVSVDSGSGLEDGASISTGSGTLVYGNEQDGVESGYDTVSVLSAILYDIRIFDDVRSAGEITSNHDQTVASNESGLLANWTFNDLSTAGVINESVGGNNLTLQHISGAGFVPGSPSLTLEVAENSVNGTTVATVTGIDPDAGDILSYSLTDDAGGRFDINVSTGEIFVLDGSLIDYETATSHNVTVQVTDSGGLTYDEVFSISITNANDAPTGTVTISGTPTEDQVLTAGNTLADADGMGAVSYQWQRDGSDIGGATGGTYTLTQADVGTTISVIASYTDGQSTAESVSSAGVGPVVNVNDAPTGSVTISGTPTEDQVLTAGNTLADEDGLGPITYQWQRGGVDIGGATGSTYTLTQADVGTTITVIASYTDVQGTAESATSAGVGPVANVNDAPTGSVTISGTPTEDQVLTAGNTLADEDGLGAISYQWQRDGSDIAGATGATYTLTQSDVSTTITVIASYTDGQGTAESVNSGGVGPIANLNNAPTGTVTISGTPTEDQVLTAGNTLADADGMGAVSYQWQRDGSDIGGATGGTYTLTQADVGTTISVIASYTDGQSTAESVSSAGVGPVVNVNDAPTGSVTISGTPTEDQVLTAGNTLADEDGLGPITYQWQRGGVDIGGATGSTYTLTQADVGTTITVIASYTDVQGTAESATSAGVGPVANVNDAPTGSVTISGTPTEDQVLTAGNTLADEDGLGAISYQWQRDGSDIAGATGATYTLTQSDVSTTITVIASYTDGQGTAESVNSGGVGPIANLNNAPTGTVTISGTPTEDQVLTAGNTLADADGMGAVSYQWQRDGSDIGGATGGTYTLTQADVGTTISVIASYTDGQSTAESVSSAGVGPVVNVNDAPTGSVTISGTPTEDQVLTAGNTLADEDGLGPITYQWQRGGVDIGGATGSTYTLTQADVGTTITVIASYTDVQGTAESATSAGVGPVANVNDAPTIAGTNTGAVTKNVDPDADGLIEVSGALTISDPDAGESSFLAGTVVGAYGNLTIDAAGNWNYATDNTQAVIQQLNTGESINDVLTVTTADGTTHTVTVTINGATAIVDQGGDDPGPAPLADPIEPDPEPDPEVPPEEILPVEDELPPREELTSSTISSSKLPVMTPLQWADPTYFVPTISMLTTDNMMSAGDGSPSAVVSIVKYLQRELASQTIAGVTSKVSELFSTDAMTQTLDLIQQQLDDTLEMDGKRGKLIIGAATGLGASVFAGYVIWAFRGSSLLLGALTAMPMWRCFDPLPVLMGDDKKRRDREDTKSTKNEIDKDETKVKELLGEERAASDTKSLNGRNS